MKGAAVLLLVLILGAGAAHRAAAQAEPIDPPIRIPRPQPVPAVLEGTVMRVDMHASPPRLHVRANGVTSSVVVGPEASVFVTEISSRRGGAAP
ncbi:MAG: hypothetical protein ACT4PY_07730 [Armatimonadota bacterium]